MKDQRLDVLRGSGNVYRDLGQDNADVKQFKALLAAEIIKTLDREHLSVRRAQVRTGIAAADSPVSAARISAVSRSTAWWGSSIALARGSK